MGSCYGWLDDVAHSFNNDSDDSPKDLIALDHVISASSNIGLGLGLGLTCIGGDETKRANKNR